MSIDLLYPLWYNKAKAIVDPLRNAGIDVKINMQSNEIYIPYSYR